ncbi:MAG: hypothetical protein ABI417_03370, partial [Coleofasciculaceae cyanobacterium]
MNNNKADISVLSSLDKSQSGDITDISVLSSLNQSKPLSAKGNSLDTQTLAAGRSHKRASRFGLMGLLVLGLTGVLAFEPITGLTAAQAQTVPA